MIINSFSKFYYIDEVTTQNFYLDFDEGAGELSAEVDSGSYTPTELALAVESALNDTGLLTYEVTFNRADRSYTIEADGNFSLLIDTGSHVGNDIFPLTGFIGADLTGLATYAGAAAASQYLPQFRLQDYVSPEDLQKAISPSVNKSASGDIEVVRFGVEKFYEFNIMFITNIDQGVGGPIRTNLSGEEAARLFLRFCTTKNKLEIMPDEKNLGDYHTILLESTEEDSKGTGYRLKELYAKGLPGYFETGKLVFRLVE